MIYFSAFPKRQRRKAIHTIEDYRLGSLARRRRYVDELIDSVSFRRHH